MKILLVGDSALALVAVALLLADQTGIEMCAAVSLRDVEAALRRCEPEVVIAHTADAVSAEEDLRSLQRRLGDTPLLVIARHELRHFLACVRAGARGFVGQDLAVSELLAGLQALARGGWVLPHAYVGDLAEAYARLSTLLQRPPSTVANGELAQTRPERAVN